jgi:hypothetical protein
MLARFSITISSVALAMVLGHVALVYVGIVYPERLETLIGAAGAVKQWIVGLGLPSKYNVWLRLLLEEKSLLFMFFSIIARAGLLVVTSSFGAVWRFAQR